MGSCESNTWCWCRTCLELTPASHGSQRDCRKLVNVSTIGVRIRSDVLVFLYRQESSWISTIVTLQLTAAVPHPRANNRGLEANDMKHANLLGSRERMTMNKMGIPTLKSGAVVRGSERIRSAKPTSSLRILVRSRTCLSHRTRRIYGAHAAHRHGCLLYLENRAALSCTYATHKHGAYVAQCQLIIKHFLAQRQLR